MSQDGIICVVGLSFMQKDCHLLVLSAQNNSYFALTENVLRSLF